MSHVVVVAWEDDRTCYAVCECGWESARANAARALRVPALVHRLAHADTVRDALAVGVSAVMDAAAPVVRCCRCGRSQAVRALGYPGGLTGEELIEIGWRESCDQATQERARRWHCPMCA